MRALWNYAARQMGRQAGKAITPAPAYVLGHQPRLLLAVAHMETALEGMRTVPPRLKLLAEMQVARVARCRYCVDIGSAIALRAGVREDQVRALPEFEGQPEFSSEEQAVLRYATHMTESPAAVTDADTAALRRYFDDRQIVELTAVIAWENQRVRFNQAAGVEPDGFLEPDADVLREAVSPY